METKKLLCDGGKPFISDGVNGGVLLITAWVITHTLTDTHPHFKVTLVYRVEVLLLHMIVKINNSKVPFH